MSTFSDRLDELLHEYDMNRSQLSRRLGVDVSTVHRWFKRGSIPSQATVSKIARIFGIDERYLYGTIDDPMLERGKNNGLLPYKMDTYRKEFKAMVERIGADARCTPYSCRHTFATMLSAQVPAHILAKLMRNDIRVTQKYYLHKDNELLLNEVNRALSQT